MGLKDYLNAKAQHEDDAKALEKKRKAEKHIAKALEGELFSGLDKLGRKNRLLVKHDYRTGSYTGRSIYLCEPPDRRMNKTQSENTRVLISAQKRDYLFYSIGGATVGSMYLHLKISIGSDLTPEITTAEYSEHDGSGLTRKSPEKRWNSIQEFIDSLA